MLGRSWGSRTIEVECAEWGMLQDRVENEEGGVRGTSDLSENGGMWRGVLTRAQT